MPFMDKLKPKKSSTEDLLNGGKGKQKEANPEGSVQDLYGLQAPVPGPTANPPAPQPSSAPPASNPAAIPDAPPAPPPPAQAPPSGEPTAQAEADPLDNPLRDLFTEASAMDPMLEALLKRVDEITAQDLITELKAFAKSVGVESAQ